MKPSVSKPTKAPPRRHVQLGLSPLRSPPRPRTFSFSCALSLAQTISKKANTPSVKISIILSPFACHSVAGACFCARCFSPACARARSLSLSLSLFLSEGGTRIQLRDVIHREGAVVALPRAVGICYSRELVGRPASHLPDVNLPPPLNVPPSGHLPS